MAQPTDATRPPAEEPAQPDDPRSAELVRAMIRAARLAREKAERRHVANLERPDPDQTAGADLGPALARERGTVAFVRDALIPLDPNDKNSRAVTGARAQRVWAPDRLLHNKTIEQYQHDAATRFYEDYLIGEHGARPAEGGSAMAVRADPWDRLPFSEQQAMRRQSFRSAVTAIGSPILSAVLVWAVLQETGGPSRAPTLEAFAKRQRPKPWPTDRATGVLIGALDALALHYGYSPADHPTQQRNRKATLR